MEIEIINPDEKFDHKTGYQKMLISRNESGVRKIKRVSGKPIKLKGRYADYKFFLHIPDSGCHAYSISEESSGARVGGGFTIAGAIENTISRITKNGGNDAIRTGILKIGLIKSSRA